MKSATVSEVARIIHPIREPPEAAQRVIIAVSNPDCHLPGYIAGQIPPSFVVWSYPGSPESKLWSAITSNTLLGNLPGPDGPKVATVLRDSDILIDFAGSVELPCVCEVWRIETGGGRPLFAPFTQSETWQRPPFVASVRLKRHAPGSTLGASVGEASVGTRVPYRKLIDLLAQTAALLIREALLHRVHVPVQPPLPEPDRHRPLAGLLGGLVRHHAEQWKSRFYSEVWSVGVSEQSMRTIARSGQLGEVAWLRADRQSSYFADPFELPGADAVLCEEYPFDTGVGRIVALNMRSGRSVPIDLCEATTHRSYPYIWAEAGDVYVLPESSEDRESILYKLGPAMTATVVAVVGRGIRMADPTIFRSGDHYWMAFSDLDLVAGQNLCLLYAEQLSGPWQPHPRNPVKIDVRSSRPAGTPFWQDSALYRPAQDCSKAYGWGIAINRVVEISPVSFSEVTERWLHPDSRSPYPAGIHTLSAAGERTLVDGKRMAIQPKHLIRKLLRKLTDHRGPVF